MHAIGARRESPPLTGWKVFKQHSSCAESQLIDAKKQGSLFKKQSGLPVPLRNAARSLFLLSGSYFYHKRNYLGTASSSGFLFARTAAWQRFFTVKVECGPPSRVHDVKGPTSLGTNYALTNYDTPAKRLRDSTTSTPMNTAKKIIDRE
jgi:hypothetical protein